MEKRILLVHDQHTQAAPLLRSLERDGYDVSAMDWTHAQNEVTALAPNAVVVDIGLPVIQCMPYCLELHDQSGAPVLVYIDEDQTPPRDTSLTFITRPPMPARLLAQLRGLLHDTEITAERISIGDMVLDLTNHQLIKASETHDLSPKLFALLHMFMTHPGQVLTRKELMKQVWETDYVGDTRTLYVHVRWLREMIEEDPGSPMLLRTIRGVGYRFDHA